MEKKNFCESYKLHECCAENELRPDFKYISFEDGYAYATNGIIAIRAKIDHISNFTEEEIALLDGKKIDFKSYKKLLTYNIVNVTESGFEVPSETSPVLFGFSRQKEIKFPDVETIFDKCRRALETATPITCTGINVALLQKIAKAMGMRDIRLDFTAGGYLVRYKKAELSDGFVDGLIMPIIVDEDE